MSRICNRCGAVVADNQTFCPQCGSPMPYGYPQPAPAPTQDNSKTVWMVLAAVLATLLVVGVIAFAVMKNKNSNTPPPAPEDQLTAMEKVVSDRVLTSGEIASLETNDRRLLRNYIFARHGYIFKDDELSNYFNSFDWYKGQYSSQEDVQSMFNDVEKRNVALLSEKPNAPKPASVPSSSRVYGAGNYTFIGHCNIREYPTSNSYIVGTAENGYPCYVTGERDGKWYWVVLPNGVQGWTHRQNLRP